MTQTALNSHERGIRFNLTLASIRCVGRRVGRPPKPTKVDPATMLAARSALQMIARELGVARGRYPDRSDPRRLTSQPEPLACAVVAVEVAEALELIAAEEVQRAREFDGVTWEDVGAAFGTSMQSAHSRFRARS